MIPNLLNAVILIGSLILIGSYRTNRRGRAELWANRALLCLAICGLCYALIGVLYYWHSFGISQAALDRFATIRSDVGGVAVGIFVSLILSGQLWKIGSRQNNEETK